MINCDFKLSEYSQSKISNQKSKIIMFPLQRGRRLRVNESIRSLVRETTLSPSDFMFPMFIAEGENYKVEIPSMPGIFRRSID